MGESSSSSEEDWEEIEQSELDLFHQFPRTRKKPQKIPRNLAEFVETLALSPSKVAYLRQLDRKKSQTSPQQQPNLLGIIFTTDLFILLPAILQEEILENLLQALQMSHYFLHVLTDQFLSEPENLVRIVLFLLQTNCQQLQGLFQQILLLTCRYHMHTKTFFTFMEVLSAKQQKYPTEELTKYSKFLFQLFVQLSETPIAPDRFISFYGDHTGVRMPNVREIPPMGYTLTFNLAMDNVCSRAWETDPQSHKYVLFSFRRNSGAGFDSFFEFFPDGQFQLWYRIWEDVGHYSSYCILSKDQCAEFFSYAETTWFQLTLVHSPRSFWLGGDYLSCFLNSKLVLTQNVPYTVLKKNEMNSNFQQCFLGGLSSTFIGDYNEVGFQGRMRSFYFFKAALQESIIAQFKWQKFDKSITELVLLKLDSISNFSLSHREDYIECLYPNLAGKDSVNFFSLVTNGLLGLSSGVRSLHRHDFFQYFDLQYAFIPILAGYAKIGKSSKFDLCQIVDKQSFNSIFVLLANIIQRSDFVCESLLSSDEIMGCFHQHLECILLHLSPSEFSSNLIKSLFRLINSLLNYGNSVTKFHRAKRKWVKLSFNFEIWKKLEGDVLKVTFRRLISLLPCSHAKYFDGVIVSCIRSSYFHFPQKVLLLKLLKKALLYKCLVADTAHIHKLCIHVCSPSLESFLSWFLANVIKENSNLSKMICSHLVELNAMKDYMCLIGPHCSFSTRENALKIIYRIWQQTNIIDEKELILALAPHQPPFVSGAMYSQLVLFMVHDTEKQVIVYPKHLHVLVIVLISNPNDTVLRRQALGDFLQLVLNDKKNCQAFLELRNDQQNNPFNWLQYICQLSYCKNETSVASAEFFSIRSSCSKILNIIFIYLLTEKKQGWYVIVYLAPCLKNLTSFSSGTMFFRLFITGLLKELAEFVTGQACLDALTWENFWQVTRFLLDILFLAYDKNFDLYNFSNTPDLIDLDELALVLEYLLHLLHSPTKEAILLDMMCTCEQVENWLTCLNSFLALYLKTIEENKVKRMKNIVMETIALFDVLKVRKSFGQQWENLILCRLCSYLNVALESNCPQNNGLIASLVEALHQLVVSVQYVGNCQDNIVFKFLLNHNSWQPKFNEALGKYESNKEWTPSRFIEEEEQLFICLQAYLHNQLQIYHLIDFPFADDTLVNSLDIQPFKACSSNAKLKGDRRTCSLQYYLRSVYLSFGIWGKFYWNENSLFLSKEVELSTDLGRGFRNRVHFRLLTKKNTIIDSVKKDCENLLENSWNFSLSPEFMKNRLENRFFRCIGQWILADSVFLIQFHLHPTFFELVIIEQLSNSPFRENSTPTRQDIKFKKKVNLHDIEHFFLRRYALEKNSLEFFLLNGQTLFIRFQSILLPDQIAKVIVENDNSVVYYKNGLDYLTPFMKQWRSGELSNFHYLLLVNKAAGRTWNDLNQYPIFPWVVADYTSTQLDLNNPKTFRDLSKPIGALNVKRLEKFKERFQMMGNEQERFLYGSHYSSIATVLFYLIRLQPFGDYSMHLQGGQSFDHADRLFCNLEETWSNVLSNSVDVKELIPEFFFLPDFLINGNHFNFGRRQKTNSAVDNVVLPAWANGSASEFIRLHRLALESDHVTQHLPRWLDLIFGINNNGEGAIIHNNVFHPLSYEVEVMDTDTDTEEFSTQELLEKKAKRIQIKTFGQTPIQLFPRRHFSQGQIGNTRVKLETKGKEFISIQPFAIIFLGEAKEATFVDFVELCIWKHGQPQKLVPQQEQIKHDWGIWKFFWSNLSDFSKADFLMKKTAAMFTSDHIVVVVGGSIYKDQLEIVSICDFSIQIGQVKLPDEVSAVSYDTKVVAIGLKSSGIVRIWHFDNFLCEEIDDVPYSKEIKLNLVEGGINCLAINEPADLVAIAFESGQVVLYSFCFCIRFLLRIHIDGAAENIVFLNKFVPYLCVILKRRVVIYDTSGNLIYKLDTLLTSGQNCTINVRPFSRTPWVLLSGLSDCIEIRNVYNFSKIAAYEVAFDAVYDVRLDYLESNIFVFFNDGQFMKLSIVNF